MQTALEFSVAPFPNGTDLPATIEGFVAVRRHLAIAGIGLLQTGAGKLPWSCCQIDGRDGLSIDLQAGAPSFVFGTVPAGLTGHALSPAQPHSAYLCGISWPENQIGILAGGSPFGLRLPAGARVRIGFSATPMPGSVMAKVPAFLKADPQTLERMWTAPSFPPGACELQSLSGPVIPLPLRARRDSERVGAVLEMLLANPKSPHPPAIVSTQLGISLRSLENACNSVTGHGPSMLHRLVRLNAVRLLLEQGGEKKVSRAANSVGLMHHGRFSAIYRDLFGESPSRTQPRGAAF